MFQQISAIPKCMSHSNLFNFISMQLSKDTTFYVKNAIITKFSRKITL